MAFYAYVGFGFTCFLGAQFMRVYGLSLYFRRLRRRHLYFTISRFEAFAADASRGF